MKIFIGNKHCCDLNYIYSTLKQLLYSCRELANDVSDADIIVFPATWCWTLQTLQFVMTDMSNILSKKEECNNIRYWMYN